MLNLAERDKAFVIAEAGTCHAYLADIQDNRYVRLIGAREYVVEAKLAGADAVKFQIFNTPIKDDMFCWIEGDEDRCSRWEQSYMPLTDWKDVKALADANGIMFLASVFQHSTVQWLNELGVEATKVASRAAKDFPYGNAPEPYLISNGMYRELPEEAYAVGGYHLQCEASYPSTMCWQGGLGGGVGFSDHSGTPWRAIDAISRGCKLIEVHFYINPEDAGPDLPASLSLDELKLVCQARDGFSEIKNHEH